MTLERHNRVQTHHVYSTLKHTDDEINNYNCGRKINDVPRTFILTITPELHVKLRNFKIDSNILEYLEVM
jgi:hypothetical protein